MKTNFFLICLVLLIGCEKSSSSNAEKQHREVLRQMYGLRMLIIEFINKSEKLPSSIDDVVRPTHPNRYFHLQNGQLLDWKFNPNQQITNSLNWLVASPLTTEHDGVKGVWVITTNMSLQVWRPEKLNNQNLIPRQSGGL